MSLMKYTCFILLLSVFSPLFSQSFIGVIDGITYYENLDTANLPITIKNVSFFTGIPSENLDTTYSNKLVCGDTLINYSFSKRNELITHSVQIGTNFYIYNNKEDYYFRTKLLEFPLDLVNKKDFKIIRNDNEYNYRYSSNQNIEYKLLIDQTVINKQHLNIGNFSSLFTPIGNIKSFHESFFNSTSKFIYTIDTTLVCIDYIPEFKSSVNEEMVELEMNPYTKDTSRLNNTQIPDLQFYDVDSNSVFLKSLFSKVNLIDFTASWCKPCLRENEYIHKLLDEFKNDSLKVISISLDKKYNEYIKSISKEMQKEENWIQLWDQSGFESELSIFFNLSAIPKFVIVNKDGLILDSDCIRPSNTKINVLLGNYLSK